jgi:hypothetical protein
MNIVILGHKIHFWMWIFAILFLIVLTVNSIVRFIRRDTFYKSYWQQWMGILLLLVLAGILNATYPFAKFWKEFLKMFR